MWENFWIKKLYKKRLLSKKLVLQGFKNLEGLLLSLKTALQVAKAHYLGKEKIC